MVQVNERQRDLMLEKIEAAAGPVQGKKFCVLGLTFKPNTDDIRESPSIYIIQKLLERGASVAAFDPAGMDNTREILPDVEYAENLYEASRDADALIIATEWNQFRNIQWDRVLEVIKTPVVVDLRNIYEPERMKEKGFTYVCVGR